MRNSRLAGALIVLLSYLAGPAPASATGCWVPGPHASIQHALNDRVCTAVVLEHRVYPESIEIERGGIRIAGPGSSTPAVIQGHVALRDTDGIVDLTDLRIMNGCQSEALSVAKGSRIEGHNVQVSHETGLPCPPSINIFVDGFESTDTARWSGDAP